MRKEINATLLATLFVVEILIITNNDAYVILIRQMIKFSPWLFKKYDIQITKCSNVLFNNQKRSYGLIPRRAIGLNRFLLPDGQL